MLGICLVRPYGMFFSGAPSVPSDGDVVYVSAPAMGQHKVRPCVVLYQGSGKTWLLPLSSDTWNPKQNPVIHFNGGLSFGVLDKVFVLPTSQCLRNRNGRVSKGAVTCCLRTLRRAKALGQLKLVGFPLKSKAWVRQTQLPPDFSGSTCQRNWNNRS